jgi:hypothetical protein
VRATDLDQSGQSDYPQIIFFFVRFASSCIAPDRGVMERRQAHLTRSRPRRATLSRGDRNLLAPTVAVFGCDPRSRLPAVGPSRATARAKPRPGGRDPDLPTAAACAATRDATLAPSLDRLRKTPR